MRLSVRNHHFGRFLLGHMIILSVGLSAFVLTGCAVTNIHSKYAIEYVESIEGARALVPNGMTMREVRDKLGRPSQASTFNETTRWIYVHQRTTYLVNVTRKMVTVVFSSGIVRDVEFSMTEVQDW